MVVILGMSIVHKTQIQVYYDDFEAASPLGSKRGAHKVSAVYYVLGNLPPQLNLALMNIHFVFLFHADDVKSYGFDTIYHRKINDIKILETQSMALPYFT